MHPRSASCLEHQRFFPPPDEDSVSPAKVASTGGAPLSKAGGQFAPPPVGVLPQQRAAKPADSSLRNDLNKILANAALSGGATDGNPQKADLGAKISAMLGAGNAGGDPHPLASQWINDIEHDRLKGDAAVKAMEAMGSEVKKVACELLPEACKRASGDRLKRLQEAFRWITTASVLSTASTPGLHLHQQPQKFLDNYTATGAPGSLGPATSLPPSLLLSATPPAPSSGAVVSAGGNPTDKASSSSTVQAQKALQEHLYKQIQQSQMSLQMSKAPSPVGTAGNQFAKASCSTGTLFNSAPGVPPAGAPIDFTQMQFFQHDLLNQALMNQLSGSGGAGLPSLSGPALGSFGKAMAKAKATSGPPGRGEGEPVVEGGGTPAGGAGPLLSSNMLGTAGMITSRGGIFELKSSRLRINHVRAAIVVTRKC